MNIIHYAPEAEDDLARIKEYITEQLINPVAAASTAAKITKHVRKLEQFPEMGTPLSSITNLVTDYRFLVCANYLVFYRIDGNDVNIIRILYERRDYITTLFGELSLHEIEQPGYALDTT